MRIKMICPTETAENVKRVREKLIYFMCECRMYGRQESRWMIAEMATRFFVCFGVGYCICCGTGLLGLNTVFAAIIAIIAALMGIILSLQLPLLTDTHNIMLHSRLRDRLRTLNAIIVALNTIPTIIKESPSLIISEEGENAEIIKNERGDIIIETAGHRYVFPKASKYTSLSDGFGGLLTVSFQPADLLIRETSEYYR